MIQAGHVHRSEPIHLDGTTLEGGGQLLRLALSLSSLTHFPIHVSRIRGKRGPLSRPGKDGGLKPAHLAAAEWLARATAATTVGLVVRSTDLFFHPRRDWSEARKDGEGGVWKDVYEQGMLVRRDSRVPMSTPGSIPLVLQAILPYVLFTDSPVPLRVIIEGGTNVSKSPSIEYVSQVLLPVLSSKVGIPPITMTVHARSWSIGRNDVGSVAFDITPLPRGSNLPAFRFSQRGEVTEVRVSILAPDENTRENIRYRVRTQLAALLPHVSVTFPVDEDSKDPKRLYLLLVAETASGCLLGCDWLYEGTSAKRRGRKQIHDTQDNAERLVKKVVGQLERELASGGCVDEYMQDQLVVFQVLADGRACVNAGGTREVTLHTQTARWVVEMILATEFDAKGVCDGLGFRAGGLLQQQMATGEKEVMTSMEGLKL